MNSTNPARVRVLFRHVQHGQRQRHVAVDAHRPVRRDMAVAPELELVVALGDAHRRAALLVRAGVECAEADFDAVECFAGLALDDAHRERMLGLRCRRDREACLRTVCVHGVFLHLFLGRRRHVERGPIQAFGPRQRLAANGARRDNLAGRVAHLDLGALRAADLDREILTDGNRHRHVPHREALVVRHDGPHEFRCAACRPARRPNTRHRPSPCCAKPPCDSPAQ